MTRASRSPLNHKEMNLQPTLSVITTYILRVLRKLIEKRAAFQNFRNQDFFYQKGYCLFKKQFL